MNAVGFWVFYIIRILWHTTIKCKNEKTEIFILIFQNPVVTIHALRLRNSPFTTDSTYIYIYVCVCVCVCIVFITTNECTNIEGDSKRWPQFRTSVSVKLSPSLWITLYITIFSLYIVWTLYKEKILWYIYALIDYNKNNTKMHGTCIKR